MIPAHGQVVVGGGDRREALGRELAHDGEGRILGVDDRGGEPLEQRRVGAPQKPQGLVRVPAVDVENLVDPPLQDVARGLQAQIVLDGADVDEADVEIGVGGGEAPGPGPGLHGQQDAHVLGPLHALQLGGDGAAHLPGRPRAQVGRERAGGGRVGRGGADSHAPIVRGGAEALRAGPQTPSRLRYSLGSMPISRLNSAEKRLAQV